ncbi:MAG: stage II sporulation protein P [Lachnospiraceae bacterium]|nr:stage II sporulation protein P [Lachnospiraceae bacterium]
MIITFIIYGLTGYLLLSFLNLGIGKVISQDMLASMIKKIAGSNMPAFDYISMQDKKMMSGNSGRDEFILNILSDPFTNYMDEKVPVNVADESEIRFFLDNANMTDYSGETDDKTENQREDEANQNAAEHETPDNVTNNEGNENNTESGAAQGETPVQNVNNSSINKIRDIAPEELTYDYLMKNFYTVVSSTTLRPEDIDAGKLMNMDMKLTTGNDKPQILIYHTHGQEGFSDSVNGDPNTGIIGVGNYLTQLLTEQYGYNVIHITDSFDYVNGVFDRSKAYDYAYSKIAQVLAENPSIEVVIDLHRDGVNENLHLVTDVSGKQTAKIMFFNGISRLNSIGEIGYLYNPYREQNLAMSLQMKVLAEEYFPDFTRKNYIQAYQYNLHLRPKSMLVEAGAQTNTFEEVKNAMEPLAMLLHMCIGNE